MVGRADGPLGIPWLWALPGTVVTLPVRESQKESPCFLQRHAVSMVALSCGARDVRLAIGVSDMVAYFASVTDYCCSQRA